MLQRIVDIETPPEYDWLNLNTNDPPPNFKRITEKEFAQNTQFGTYTPKFMGFNQIRIDKPTKDQPKHIIPLHSLHYFIFHDGTGVAIEVDYCGKGHYDKPKPEEPLEHIRYYSFAKCAHTFTEKTVGRCLHEYTCSKCGYAYTTDSSD